MTNPTSIQVLQLRQVQEILSLSRSSIYDRLDPDSRRYDASFPKPIKLHILASGRGRIGFMEADIRRWLMERAGYRNLEV